MHYDWHGYQIDSPPNNAKCTCIHHFYNGDVSKSMKTNSSMFWKLVGLNQSLKQKETPYLQVPSHEP